MPAWRPCLGCSQPIPPGTYRGRCTDCRRAHDAARGTKTQRGYGSTIVHSPLGRMTYTACRASYAKLLRTQPMTCWRCGGPIDPDNWVLGHCDNNRAVIHGPECPACNYATTGRVKCPHNSH